MVRAGMGWAVMPQLAVDWRDPGIDVRPLSPALLPRQVCVVWRRDRTLSPVAARLVDIARDVARDIGPFPSRSRPDLRFVVYGAGAVGGVVGGRLFQHGHDVVLVARGDHGRAIAERGLTVEWPEGSITLPVPVVDHPCELTFGPDDIVVVGVKSQDTAGVVEALVDPPRRTPRSSACRTASPTNPPSCAGSRVHAVTVMAPTWHLEPGVVRAYTRQAVGLLDIGRWPSGVDDVTEAVAAAFRASGFESVARPDIARWKYTKLLLNLGNPIDALSPSGPDAARLWGWPGPRARPC